MDRMVKAYGKKAIYRGTDRNGNILVRDLDSANQDGTHNHRAATLHMVPREHVEFLD